MNKKDLFEQLAQWGSVFSPEMIQQTQALYAPLVATPNENQVVRNTAYGPDERHRLDIFGGDAVKNAPVILFVHGGGFVMGDKGGQGSPFYNNVGSWAIEQGFIGVTMTYRLAPAHSWPSGREDVIAAVQWLTQNISNHGGDPKRIFIMGQSAGAVHVADSVAEPGVASDNIRGALMISGIYDIGRITPDNFQRSYYTGDTDQYDNYSSLRKLVSSTIPTLFAVCEHDPLDFQLQANWLVDEWIKEKNCWPAMHWLRGHNHLSSVAQISSPFDTLGPIITDFIQANS